MNIKIFIIFFLSYFVCSHFVTAQIDSTKRSLYLKCANEVIINYPKDIDTTKITFEVKGGGIIINSVSKIILIPHSAKSTLQVLYNGKELFSRKYNVKLVPAPEIKCILTKDKFPRRLRVDVIPDKNFLKNCPLDARYQFTFIAQLYKDRELVVDNLFTDRKQQLTQQEWFEIRELFKKNPTSKWMIVIDRCSLQRMNFEGELEGLCFPAIYRFDYTLESFER
ncbi:hypothetical protein [Bernardetia sp. MNP-M8]|uniref:hypothetical protein n=1 Tax=Bernardetia sp. MNP-M8 TaxID=3127470 RepID=UPI0030D378DA